MIAAKIPATWLYEFVRALFQVYPRRIILQCYHLRTSKLKKKKVVGIVVEQKDGVYGGREKAIGGCQHDEWFAGRVTSTSLYSSKSHRGRARFQFKGTLPTQNMSRDTYYPGIDRLFLSLWLMRHHPVTKRRSSLGWPLHHSTSISRVSRSGTCGTK